MSDIDREEHFHPTRIFTCPFCFNIMIFVKLKDVKGCVAICKITETKKGICHFVVSCGKSRHL